MMAENLNSYKIMMHESSVYNNYIFSLEDCEVDVEFADTPSEPDYDDGDYVSVWYVPLNI